MDKSPVRYQKQTTHSLSTGRRIKKKLATISPNSRRINSVAAVAAAAAAAPAYKAAARAHQLSLPSLRALCHCSSACFPSNCQATFRSRPATMSRNALTRLRNDSAHATLLLLLLNPHIHTHMAHPRNWYNNVAALCCFILPRVYTRAFFGCIVSLRVEMRLESVYFYRRIARFAVVAWCWW